MTADRSEVRLVVGIGASAGGVEALSGLFRTLSPESGMAYVVVTHLGAGRPSYLDKIIARQASLPVAFAADGEPVQPNHVYVLPPGNVLTIADGRLRLHPTSTERPERNPIDIFFASLAADQGDRAVAVVLSGGGSDGTLGAKAIKDHGGLVIAQGPDSAPVRHPSMPASAVASGLVDLVLPAEAIAGRIASYANGFEKLAALSAEEPWPEGAGHIADARAEICRILRDQTGHDFAGYKEKTFQRRVQRRMQLLHVDTVEGYVQQLASSTEEVNKLFQDLLINVTSFFRDADAFAALEQLVIPHLFEGGGAVRVWVPGCATGEEAYTIAMLLREHMDSLESAPVVQVFATDIDDAALGVARAGRYPSVLLEAMPAERIARHFVSEGEVRTLKREVRDLCVFSGHSLIRDPPFSRIDLISCRNLLIYLNPELQERVVPLFHYALRPGGYLMLGGSENLSRHADLFTAVDKKNRIFQARQYGRPRVTLPLFAAGGGVLPHGTSDLRVRRGARAVRQSVEAMVLDRYAPAHVVVDRDGDVVFYSSRTGRYFEAPTGSPTNQVLMNARKGLRLELHGALREAMATRRVVARGPVPIELDGDATAAVSVSVVPFGDNADDPLFLVLFNELGPPHPARGAQRSDATAARDDAERELRDTREQLESTIEEYETALEELKSANEELLSMNEELQSTNEEMETSKEELQSVNEEMKTVNAELSSKVDELDRARNDLENLFSSTQIATIFLDRALVVRSFTPAVGAIFSLIGSDRGRPLMDIATQLDYPGLGADLRSVVETREPVERRVAQKGGGRSYHARLLPYWTTGRVFDGVVATFIDVTEIAQAEAQLHVLVSELNHRVRNMLTIVIALASHTLSGLPGIEQPLAAFMERLRSMARTFDLLSRASWSSVGLNELVDAEVAPYALDGKERVKLDGPKVMLAPRTALSLGLVLHELATNAAKYGAYLGSEGCVHISWTVDGKDDAQMLCLEWKESGGPAIQPPTHRGFGTALIEQQVRYGADGEVEFAYPPEGLVARIRMALPRAG